MSPQSGKSVLSSAWDCPESLSVYSLSAFNNTSSMGPAYTWWSIMMRRDRNKYLLKHPFPGLLPLCLSLAPFQLLPLSFLSLFFLSCSLSLWKDYSGEKRTKLQHPQLFHSQGLFQQHPCVSVWIPVAASIAPWQTLGFLNLCFPNLGQNFKPYFTSARISPKNTFTKKFKETLKTKTIKPWSRCLYRVQILK